MTVSFEYKNKIIANAELALIPHEDESVTIWGKEYTVGLVYHNVEIKQKASGKKAVIEKIICELREADE